MTISFISEMGISLPRSQASYNESVDLGGIAGGPEEVELAGLRRPPRALVSQVRYRRRRFRLLQRSLFTGRSRPLRPVGIRLRLPQGKLVLPDRVCGQLPAGQGNHRQQHRPPRALLADQLSRLQQPKPVPGQGRIRLPLQLRQLHGNQFRQARPHRLRRRSCTRQHQPVHFRHQLLVLCQQRRSLRLRDQPGTQHPLNDNIFMAQWAWFW